MAFSLPIKFPEQEKQETFYSRLQKLHRKARHSIRLRNRRIVIDNPGSKFDSITTPAHKTPDPAERMEERRCRRGQIRIIRKREFFLFEVN